MSSNPIALTLFQGGLTNTRSTKSDLIRQAPRASAKLKARGASVPSALAERALYFLPRAANLCAISVSSSSLSSSTSDHSLCLQYLVSKPTLTPEGACRDYCRSSRTYKSFEPLTSLLLSLSDSPAIYLTRIRNNPISRTLAMMPLDRESDRRAWFHLCRCA